jgi:hypothetical protein
MHPQLTTKCRVIWVSGRLHVNCALLHKRLNLYALAHVSIIVTHVTQASFPEVNAKYAKYFPTNPPARATFAGMCRKSACHFS